MQKYQNNVQTLDGRAIVGASVTVTEFPGGAPATVYNSNGSGVITQPILTNGDGEFFFYAANGRYQLSVTGGGISVAQAITDIVLFDPDDAGGVITGSELSNTSDAGQGDALVGVKQPFTGAIPRSQHDKNIEVLSVLDFGTTSNLSSALSAAITALPAWGGTIKIPRVQGDYVFPTAINITRNNVSIEVEPDVFIDMSAIASGNCISIQGTFGSEINLGANVTTGDTTITTTTPHGLTVGDWFLLKSQRACLSDDAGVDWRLGETTASVNSPFFAEPCIVETVNSVTSVTVAAPLIFPNYRTDNTQETYTPGRASTTVQKINFVQGFKWKGGSLKSRVANTFYGNICYEPYIEIDNVDLGSAYGASVLMESCLRPVIRASSEHDTGLVPGSDHAEYNSFKELGCWWAAWHVVDRYGMQGLDITYRSGGHPSIQPDCYISSYDNAENSMTFHSGAYGGRVIHPRSIRAAARGIWIRSRFVEVIEPFVLGSIEGVNFQGWGGMNGGLRGGHFEGCGTGVYLERTGVTDGPAYRSVTVDGPKFIRCGYGVYVAGTNPQTATAEYSGITIRDVTGTQCTSDVVRIEEYVNGVTVDGIDCQEHRGTSRFALRCNQNAVGHEIRKIVGLNIGSTNVLININGIADTTTFPTATYPNNLIVVDTESCRLTGTGTIWSGSATYVKNVGSTYTFMSDDAKGRPVTTGSGSATTLTVPPGLFALGAKIEIYQAGTGQITIAPGAGVSFLSFSGLKSAGQNARIIIQQRTSNVWFVTGNTVP